jgi:hypothetical protein
MTLKEKYLDLLKDYNPDYKNTEAKGCEVIADDFAIGFAEWYLKKSEKYDSYLKLKNDTKKLLEIYKKEIDNL